MTIRTILVPVCPDVEFQNQLDAAADLARVMEAHINAVYIVPDPMKIVAGMPPVAVAAGLTAAAIRRDGEAAAAAAKDKFERWRQQAGLAARMVERSLRTPYAQWSERTGEIAPTVARCGRLSDLIILNRPNVSLASSAAFDAAVFESGRPTLLLNGNTPSDLLRHILIAWNGSLEATRAVAGSMALLREADQVSIFTTLSDDVLDTDLDLADSLSWHGINPRYFHPKTPGDSTGEALLRVVKDVNPSMLVMGAYTHSRLREAFLGGVTRHVLDHAGLPVLMMH